MNVERIQHTHLFTQIGTGANVAGSLRLINPSTTTPSRGSVGFFGDDGTPLALSIGGEPPEPNFAFSVPPLGTADLDVTGPAGVVSAAAQVLVDQPLGGITQAAFPGSGVAAVGESWLGDRFVMPVVEDEAAGLSTGVAIFNGDLEGVQLILYGPGGFVDEIAIERIDVPAGGYRVIFVRELFPSFRTFQGTMTVEAGFARAQEKGQLAAIGLQRGPNPGQLTTLPMILVGPSSLETLHFARFASGGDTASSALFLINPSPAAQATGTLAFFDENGDGWNVAVNGLSPTTSVPVDLPPLGSAVFATSAEGGNHVELDFSRPGKPTDNAYIESFNGKLRAECLNEKWFLSLADAQGKLTAWLEEVL